MKVNSSRISEIDPWIQDSGANGHFDVKFPNGRVYRYFNVPQGIYHKLIHAPSVGSFFDLFIVKAGYKYQEIISEVDWPNIMDEVNKMVHAYPAHGSGFVLRADDDIQGKVKALVRKYLLIASKEMSCHEDQAKLQSFADSL